LRDHNDQEALLQSGLELSYIIDYDRKNEQNKNKVPHSIVAYLTGMGLRFRGQQDD
jgi:hypothetical protein